MKRKWKERMEYYKAVSDILNRFKAVYTGNDDDAYPYTIATKVGQLKVSLGKDCCVCTRFEDVEAARGLDLGDRLNPHSGKWNWMGGNDHQGDMLDLAYFQQALRKIV